MTRIQCLAVGVVLAAASISSAGTAAADPLTGSYTATVTGSIGQYFGSPAPTWVITPCGPDCIRVDAQGAELHGQNGAYSGTFDVRASDNGEVVTCTRSITETLAAGDFCPQPLGLIVNYQLTKNG